MKSNTDIALLLIRVGLALVFIAHGWDKITGMEGTLAFFAKIGLSSFWAYIIAYVELLGGLSMLIGFATGWAGVLLAATMAGAIVIVKLSKGFIGGYEFDLMLFLSAISVSLAGPGSYTIKKLFKRA